MSASPVQGEARPLSIPLESRRKYQRPSKRSASASEGGYAGTLKNKSFTDITSSLPSSTIERIKQMVYRFFSADYADEYLAAKFSICQMAEPDSLIREAFQQRLMDKRCQRRMESNPFMNKVRLDSLLEELNTISFCQALEERRFFRDRNLSRDRSSSRDRTGL